MRYSVLYFDADGTLFDYDAAEQQALSAALTDFGFIHNHKEFHAAYRKINHSLWLDLETGKISKDDLRVERFRQLFGGRAAGFSMEEFSTLYLKYLSQGGQLLPGALNVVKRIKPGRRLVILTNGIKEVQESRMENSPLKPYIDLLVTSEEIGAPKPDPAMFSFASGELGIPARSGSLMIGDSLTSDIQGGINFGIDTCWYNRGRKSNDTEICPDYEIHRLKELEKII